jgi:hypothetical protein
MMTVTQSLNARLNDMLWGLKIWLANTQVDNVFTLRSKRLRTRQDFKGGFCTQAR